MVLDGAQQDVPFQREKVHARGVQLFTDTVIGQSDLDTAQAVVLRIENIQCAHDPAVGAGKFILFHLSQQFFFQVHHAFSFRCICIKISNTRSSF